jgi:hypothetical protein|tara:strand:+ start:131 stop:790 length:660 start_codon:yes stop_codon:yes gene_type:complete
MMNTEDTLVAKALVLNVIESGHVISIYDSEEWCITFSNNADEILAALDSTGEDLLKVSKISGGNMISTLVEMAFDEHSTFTTLGSFYCIWDNGNEESPMVAISDYSDNEYCNGVIKELEEIFPDDWRIRLSPGRDFVDKYLPNHKYFGSPGNTAKDIKAYWADIPTFDPSRLNDQDLANYLRDMSLVADSEATQPRMIVAGMADLFHAVAERLDPQEES